MRIVVIGATGHIGTWLVPRLIRRGHQVVTVSRGSRAPYQFFPEWDRAERVVIDRDRTERNGTFGRRMADLRPDVVVDLICFELESAMHIVDALRGRVKHLLHCGTLWVHGDPKTRPYDETASREPFGEYGIRKAQIEQFLVDEARRGFPATILHPGHITGPGWDPVNPAGNLNRDVFDRLASGEMVELPEDGSATLQHVHADDVASAFELAIEKRAASIGEAFHIAAKEPVTMRCYADAVAAWSGREARFAFLPWDEWKQNKSARDVDLTWDHMKHSPYASVAKAESVLEFEPRYSAVEAVRDAVRAQNP